MSLPNEIRVAGRVGLAVVVTLLVVGQATARAQTPPPAIAAPVIGDPVVPPAPAGDPAAVPPAPGGDTAPPPVPASYGSASAPQVAPPSAQAPAVDTARVESLRNDDAHADHIILGPTAFTAPRGSVYLSNYELLVVQGGVAITDEFQVTLTTLLPLIESQPFFADLSAKYAFLKTPRFHMAGIASILGLGDGDIDERFALGRATVVATGCITENCYVAASASAMLWLSPDIDRVVPVTLNLGITARLVGVFSLLAEANFIAAFGDLSGARSVDLFGRGALLGYGARFSSGNFGFDLTFVKPLIADDSSDDFFVIGVPWLAFTYRTDALF
jgi:hypothetical protein